MGFLGRGGTYLCQSFTCSNLPVWQREALESQMTGSSVELSDKIFSLF